MKSLLESIFGGKESIANASKESLWEGYEEAWTNARNHFQVNWTPKNKNNILTAIYGPKAKTFHFHGTGPLIYQLSVEYTTCAEIFIPVQINTAYWSEERLAKAADYIKRAFRSDPEMLLRDGKRTDRDSAWLIIHWREFKKKYKPKK